MKIKADIARWIFIVALVLSAIPKALTGGLEVSPPLALVLGVAFALTCESVYPVFTKKTQKFLLQASVVGLGFGMNAIEALSSGKEGMVFTIFSVVFVMVLGSFVGQMLKLDKKTSYLVSSGTAICGGSAIAAVAPIVEADDNQMSVSLGTIFLLNALALLIFPPIGHALGLTQQEFGNWAAIAIHDTSSVVGAGAAYGEEALKIATTVKCTRALWILPLAFVSMAIWRKKGTKVAVPWFIFLFALAMVLNTLFPIPQAISGGIVIAAKRGFTVTLFLIGTALSPKALKACGVKPFVQGVALWFAIAALSLFIIKF